MRKIHLFNSTVHPDPAVAAIIDIATGAYSVGGIAFVVEHARTATRVGGSGAGAGAGTGAGADVVGTEYPYVQPFHKLPASIRQYLRETYPGIATFPLIARIAIPPRDHDYVAEPVTNLIRVEEWRPVNPEAAADRVVGNRAVRCRRHDFTFTHVYVYGLDDRAMPTECAARPVWWPWSKCEVEVWDEVTRPIGSGRWAGEPCCARALVESRTWEGHLAAQVYRTIVTTAGAGKVPEPVKVEQVAGELSRAVDFATAQRMRRV